MISHYLLVLIALTGFSFGYFQSHGPWPRPGQEHGNSHDLGKNRFPTSAENSEISYESVPCPSEEKYQELKNRVKLGVDPPEFNDEVNLNAKDACTKPNRGKMAKLLLFMDQMKVELPSDWQGGADGALKDPLGYVVKMIKRMEYDFSLNYTAHNADGVVVLGSGVFTDTLMGSVTTMIHEAHHSDPLDPRHVVCRYGFDINCRKACDQEFKTDETAGSTAFGDVSFAYGLTRFLPNLNDEQKGDLESDIVWWLSNRFNKIPSWAALPFDLIYMTSNENLYYLHPFLHRLVPAIDRISEVSSDNHFGLYMKGVDGKKYSYSFAWGKSSQPKASLWEETGKSVLKFGNLRSSDMGSWEFGITDDVGKELKYVQKDKNKNHVKIADVLLDPSGVVPVDIFQSFELQPFLRDSTGKLYEFAFQEDPTQVQRLEESKFNINGGWRWAGPDVLYQNVYGIHDNELYFSGEDRVLQKSDFQMVVTSDVLNYSEGLGIRLLAGNSVIQIDHYAKEIPMTILKEKDLGVKWTSVALVSGFTRNRAFMRFHNETEDDVYFQRALKACPMTNVLNNARVGGFTGISPDGNLMFASYASFAGDFVCDELKLPKPIAKISNQFGSALEENEKGVLNSGLVIEYQDGTSEVLEPYEWKYKIQK